MARYNISTMGADSFTGAVRMLCEIHQKLGEMLAKTYWRKVAMSLSVSSKESQTLGRLHVSSHWLTSVLFPYPAGAVIRVSVPSCPRCSRPFRLGLSTTSAGEGGLCSLVRRMGSALAGRSFLFQASIRFAQYRVF